ncbi:hypothetical protein EVA_02847 [gut metagenome]|uniref:Uncharacterized protein n=1 Tax=gut metagenome TaxID=749906 RepID=J9D8E0_9ZZZZ
MAATLKMTQNHHTAQMTNVQRIGCRIKTDVSRNLLFGKQFFSTRHHIVEHATPSQFFYKIHIVNHLKFTYKKTLPMIVSDAKIRLFL